MRESAKKYLLQKGLSESEVKEVHDLLFSKCDRKEPPTKTITQVKNFACKVFGIKPIELDKKYTPLEVKKVQHAICYSCRVCDLALLREIAQVMGFGCASRTSHSLNSAADLMFWDKEYSYKVFKVVSFANDLKAIA